MQITLDIPDNFSLEKIKLIIFELEKQLKTSINLINDKNLVVGKPIPKFGSAKGLISMSADFDEPLEDFADYMP